MVQDSQELNLAIFELDCKELVRQRYKLQIYLHSVALLSLLIIGYFLFLAVLLC